MPTYGGYSPYPKRFGGSRNGKPQLQVIHEGLSASRGSAYSKDPSSIVWIENMAIARAIWGAWCTNQRLANQVYPLSMTDMLSRWEAILAIPVPSDASDDERRREVMTRMERVGKAAIHSRFFTVTSDLLGNYFVGIEYIDLSLANVLSPDASYPWGHQVDGWPWYSTVAHVLIRLQKPAGTTDADFWEQVKILGPVMDELLPIDSTWDFYRAPAVGAPIDVTGGPSAGGWYLDEPNLDLLVFDV